MNARFPFDSVILRFPEADRRQRRLRELIGHCERLCEVEAAGERVGAIVQLVDFLAHPDRALPAPLDGGAVGQPPEWRRVAVLVAILESDEGARAAFGDALARLLADSQAIGLFAEAGLPNDRGLFNETTDRLFHRILPQPRDEHDLARLVSRLFPSKRAVAFIEQLPVDLFARLWRVLGGGGTASAPSLLQPAVDAFCLLGARVQALGLSEEIRVRSRAASSLTGSPFFRLPRIGDALVMALGTPGQIDRRDAAAVAECVEAIGVVVKGCRDEIAFVLERLEATGVSLDVVYGLDAIERSLQRMEALVRVLAAPAGDGRANAAHRLLVALCRARLSDRSLVDLARSTTRLLARKIIERAGRTGEHYIAATRREYFQFLGSAAGGGVLTLGTAAGKILIAAAHFPLFIEGFLSGCDYALSFVVMQILGFTLATKQPSMTAATLAGVIRDTAGPSRNQELVTTVARIVRSQLCAAAGNISAVSVSAFVFDLIYRTRGKGHFVHDEKAASILASLSPIAGPTIFYACLTGVILWLSSLAAGWVENFAVYRRLPQALAEHRLGRLLGERTMTRFAAYFAKNISGWGGSVALGFMLGMTPALGIFFGLKLDVRHVTLSSGSLVLAAVTRGAAAFTDPAVLWAMAGIAVIFVCNLGVSFLLALVIALRARAVPTRDRFTLARVLLVRFFTRPGEFLLPPKPSDDPPATAGHAHG